MMKASDILLAKIREFEGCRLKAYKCPAGIWTIGVGHIKGVKEGMVITEKRATELLKEDLATFESYVNKLGVCKTQGQYDALVDFSFNLGCASLGSSTLLKYIKAGKPTADIQAQFRRWNKAGGRILQGLVKRREWECQRWASKS